MLQNKSIAVVVPAFNEEGRICHVLRTMPSYVDKIYVVDDLSTDKTKETVAECADIDSRIMLISHKVNQGVGGAIVSGYKQALLDDFDITVVMAGDGQMHPDDFMDIVQPVLDDRCDYSKGNRFLRGNDKLRKIPKHRLFGNLVLSMLTKIVSGYWHVSDTQGGYTAINKKH